MGCTGPLVASDVSRGQVLGGSDWGKGLTGLSFLLIFPLPEE